MPIVKSLATPIVWIAALLVVGVILTRRARKKGGSGIGWYAVLVGTLLLLALSFKPTAKALVYSLECRYRPAQPGVLETLDTVVVLGYCARPSGGLRVAAELAGDAYGRLFAGVKAFKESGANLLALCGGRSREDTESEAEVMKAVALYMGCPRDKILTETRSHDTMQNAAYLAELLPAGQNRRIGLVTSAWHMLRAEKVFKGQFPNDTIVPVPTNYLYDPVRWSAGTFVPSVEALRQSTVALHEWIGIAWYSLRYW